MKELIAAHEALLPTIEKDSPDWKFVRSTNGEKEIALFMADYKCEGCGTEELLTLHHLVPRGNRSVLPFNRLFKQRHTTGNLSILCVSCHRKAELRGSAIKPDDIKITFSKETIAKYKKKAGVE